MVSASEDLDTRLLEFVSGDGLPEKTGWLELRCFLKGAKIDISTRTKDEWIAYAENLKRNYQTRLQVEQDILLDAAKDEEDSGEITWKTLQCYLKGAKVDVAVHEVEEWMNLLDIARRTVQEEKAEGPGKRSTSSNQVESDGESDTDSGYQSDTAQDKNDKKRCLFALPVDVNARPVPVGYYYSDKVEEHRISQTICTRCKLKPDIDGYVTLKFRYKDRKKPFLRKCIVVPAGVGVPDVHFGREPRKTAKKLEDLCADRNNQGLRGSRDVSQTRSAPGNLQYSEDDEIINRVIVQALGHTISEHAKDTPDNPERSQMLGRTLREVARGAFARPVP